MCDSRCVSRFKVCVCVRECICVFQDFVCVCVSRFFVSVCVCV